MKLFNEIQSRLKNELPKELINEIFEYTREYVFINEYNELLMNESANKTFESIFYTKVPQICFALYVNDNVFYGQGIMTTRRYKKGSMRQLFSALKLQHDKIIYKITRY